MKRNLTMTLAIFNGIGKLLSTISIFSFVVFLILCFVSGFSDWRKDYLIYSIIGTVAFWIIARICKFIIRRTES